MVKKFNSKVTPHIQWKEHLFMLPGKGIRQISGSETQRKLAISLKLLKAVNGLEPII